MTKTPTLILLAVLALSNLYGCGGSGSSNNTGNNFSSQAESYDMCNQLLVAGITETASDSSSEAKLALDKSALNQWLCSNETEHDLENTLVLNVLNIVSPQTASVSTEQRMSDYCSEVSNNYKGSEISHYLIDRADSLTVDAWSQCIKDNRQDKLACYAVEDNTSLTIAIDLDESASEITNTETTVNNIALQGSPVESISPGVSRINYERFENENASFSLKGLFNQTQEVRCDYSIPEQPLSEQDWHSCEAFRSNAQATGQISSTDYILMRDKNEVPLLNDEGEYIGRYECQLYTEAPADQNWEACEAFRIESLINNSISDSDYLFMRDNNQVPLFNSNSGELEGYYDCELYEAA